LATSLNAQSRAVVAAAHSLHMCLNGATHGAAHRRQNKPFVFTKSEKI